MEPSTKRQLVERTYLGLGYLHHFRHNTTGEIIFVPCTEEEYLRLSTEGGSKYNPVLDGYTWICSEGGTVKVNTPDTVLGKDEYCIVDDKALVRLDGKEQAFNFVEQADVADGKIDDTKWQ